MNLRLLLVAPILAVAACNALFGVASGAPGFGAGGAAAASGVGGGGAGGLDLSAASSGGGGSIADGGVGASTRLGVGTARACFIEDDGSVRCWGDNSGGYLVAGDPHTMVPVAEAVPGIAGAQQVTAGAGQQCVLEAQGAIVCWGDDDDGELGGPAVAGMPQTVSGLAFPALEVQAADRCTCARLTDGSVTCWGQAQTGCLGVPMAAPAVSGPVAVPGVAGAVQLVVGAFADPSCARLASGTVICWSQSIAPTPIPGVTDAIAVAAGGGHVFVLRKAGGLVWSAATPDGLAWLPAAAYPAQAMAAITAGNSFCGLQSADGLVACADLTATATPPPPVPIAGQPPGTVLEIAAGRGGTYGASLQCLRTGALPSIYCWGDDQSGALGAGAPEDLRAPAAVAGVSGATSLTAGVSSTSVVLADGSVMFWGSDPALTAAATATPLALASLGTGNATVESNDVGEIAYVLGKGAPRLLEQGAAVSGGRLLASGFTDFVDARSSSVWDLGLRAGGTVVVYGVGTTSNADGIFGDGTTAATAGETGTVPGIASATALAARGYDYGSQPAHACAILGPSGTVSCWGGNHEGEIGSGVPGAAPVTTPTPVAIPGGAPVVSLAAGDRFTCAVAATGAVYCWGFNDVGQLGSGGTSSAPTPVAVTGITTALGVTALQGHACAWLADQTVRCWGANDAGQLGDGTFDDRGAPVAVAGLTGVVQVAAGAEHTCARVGGGGVSCWGSSYSGQVGTGATGIHPVPLAVQGL